MENKKLQLEEHNFRVDSIGWEQVIYYDRNHDKIVCLENRERDILEFVGGVPGEIIGQQLFTLSAGKREMEKVNKRIPTKEE
ncbi:MAG: hypothetical protein KAS02_02065 [Candidatus Pacebacteria bacterium]|nr:hypothetical protein [Candidatus Paceibacterota bacterium]